MWMALTLLALHLAAPRDETQDPTALSVEREQQAEQAADLGLDVHGFSVLSLRGGDRSADSGINIFMAQLELRYATPRWGVFATPRLRVLNLASGRDQGAAYCQQAYIYLRHPFGDLKLGKLYRRFGRLWDYGMYGPIAAIHDITMQPDYGVAAEGAPQVGERWSIDYAAQYLPVDGRSLSLTRAQPIGAQSVRRRHIAVARLAPAYQWDSVHSLSVGLSGETFEVRQPPRWQRVGRLGVDAEVRLGGLEAFVELGQQWGTESLLDAQAAPSGPNLFVWGGTMFAGERFNLRYNLGVMRFWQAPFDVEVLHQPGIEYLAHPNLSLVFEAAIYTSSQYAAGTQDGYRERSAFVAALGKF